MASALTLSGWDDQPKCFKFMERESIHPHTGSALKVCFPYNATQTGRSRQMEGSGYPLNTVQVRSSVRNYYDPFTFVHTQTYKSPGVQTL